MRSALISALWCVAVAVSAQADRFQDWGEAKDKAKQADTPVAVFVHGSNWNREGTALLSLWDDPRMEKLFVRETQLLAFDYKQLEGEEEKAFAEKNKEILERVRGVPAVVLFDAQARPVAQLSGPAEIEAAGGLVAAFRRMDQTLQERDRLWQQAEQATGTERAVLLGKGLDRLEFRLGADRTYQPVREQIRQADPQDESGYSAKYQFSVDRLIGSTMKHIADRRYDQAEEEFATLLRNPRLSPEQRQQVLSLRFALYQKWPEKKSGRKKVLQEILDIDSGSTLGVAAAHYLDHLD